jgi:hypothetical protein
MSYGISSADAQAALCGWPYRLLAEKSTARSRAYAEAQIELHRDLINGLPAYARELLLERLQDATLAIRDCNGCCGDV